ncbi:MAG TPA: hypothetical protein VM143_02065 [Acidimicrobiales bacterium]|nr:hypothetical protein [Acidimicrobiales bacterium]
MIRRRAALPILVALALVPTACNGLGNGDDTGPKATGRWGGVHSGVCAAVTASVRNEPTTARRDFEDVHAGLHELAAAVEREDRPAAARLLEAKQRVEAGGTTQDLRQLAVAVAAAIELTGDTAPDTCP